MIDIATLKEYIKVLEDSSLQTLELSDGKDSIYLEKPSAAAPAAAPVAAVPAVSAPAPVQEAAPADSGKISPARSSP